MIQLIAFDLDGTLMGADQRISDRVRQAVAHAQSCGAKITLATGRMFSATLPFARALNITTPLICYQGGWIQAQDGDVLHRVSLPHDLARTALALGTTQGWHAVLYADGKLFVQALQYSLDFYKALLGQDLTIGEPWDTILTHHVVDKVLYVAEPERIPAMAKVLQQNFAAQAEVVQSHKMFVEIVPSGVDKGNALAWLAQHLNIPQSHTMAVGDQENDLAMVRWAGVGVAMGNAIAAVKQAAAWIAPPVTEDGAAVTLEHFIFKDENF